VLAPKADKVWPLFGDLFLDEPMPVDGYVSLDGTKPGVITTCSYYNQFSVHSLAGFGVTLNPAVRSSFVRPHARVSPSFEAIEAAKEARTLSQSEWLQRASTRIPIGRDDA
jgi:hypothetical protein